MSITAAEWNRGYQPVMHTKTGDVTWDDVRDMINNSIGRKEDLEGLDKEVWEVAEAFGFLFLDNLSDDILEDRKAERDALEERINGFIDGYKSAKTGNTICS